MPIFFFYFFFFFFFFDYCPFFGVSSSSSEGEYIALLEGYVVSGLGWEFARVDGVGEVFVCEVRGEGGDIDAVNVEVEGGDVGTEEGVEVQGYAACAGAEVEDTEGVWRGCGGEEEGDEMGG